MPDPHPKPAKVINLASLARVHTETCIKVLAGYARNPNTEEVPPAVRVQAIGMLLDRGWGRVQPSSAGEAGAGDIRVTIRHIIEALPAGNGKLVSAPILDGDFTRCASDEVS
jgi:hypothetical protein